LFNSEREAFEQEYRDWIRLMSRDAASRLSALAPQAQVAVLKAYEDFKDPLTVFRQLTSPERVRRLAGERISSFIVIETDAVTFFPSICSGAPGIQDYAVAMNRRVYYRGLWFPIISLNFEYIRQSSDRLLCFALEHEFEMNRIYMEISSALRQISRDEKHEIMDRAGSISRDRLKITPQELIEDEQLMHRLSLSQPLLPKPYAEMAMLFYLESNYSSLCSFGQESRTPDEESFGIELYQEFQSWSDFSKKTYESYVREIVCNLREADRGYG